MRSKLGAACSAGPAPGTRLTPEQAAEVLRKHESMCWWLARRCGHGRGLSDDDLEDLAAEARTQFVRATHTFDPSTGYQFATYAMRAAQQRVLRAVRLYRARGVRVPVGYDVAGPVPAVCDLDARLPGGLQTVAELVAAPEPEAGPDLPADFWDRVHRQLNAAQRECVWLRFRDGLTLGQIGAKIGRSKERARQVIVGALAKLRESGAFDKHAAGG